MKHIKRTTSGDTDFKLLVSELDADLAVRDGSEHAFYAQFNKIDSINNVIIYYSNDVAVACGAFKPYNDHSIEIKRMYVKPEYRGKGIGSEILKELEKWAREIDFKDSILETGKKQPEAIRLYQKSGYQFIPNFGQYKNVVNSVCMGKTL